MTDDGSPGNWREYQAVDSYEPEEFDPNSLGPGVPEPPEPPDPSDNDVDPRVERRFWSLVVVFNLALFGAAVGPMFIAFEGNWDLGGKLTAAGAVLGLYGFYRYRSAKQFLAERDDGDGGEEDGGSARDDAVAGSRDEHGDARAGATTTGRPTAADGRGMRTVEDADGHRYVLLKRSEEASLVRDPETGEHTHVPNGDLAVVEDASALTVAATGVPAGLRRVLTAVPDDRALGLLLEIDDRGPVGVRALLAYDLCESDLHGLLAEFRTAGLITEAEADIGGERGYETTDQAATALARLRG